MKKEESKDKFDSPPDIKSYYALWGKHEFDLDFQRNLLLHFIADNSLDGDFIKYLDYHFPEGLDGVRTSRKDLEEELRILSGKLNLK